jgi:hypothetical protein
VTGAGMGVLRRAVSLGAVLFVGAGAAGAQTTRGVASITGSVHGAIPPVSCIDVAAGGVAIQSFEELANAGASHRSFRIQLATSCVAPLYQALFSKEPLQVRVGPVVRGTGGSSPIQLADARLTRVELSTGANEHGIRFPVATLEMISSRVTGVALHAGRTEIYSEASLSPRASGEAWVHDGVTGTSVRLAAQPPGLDVTFASGDQRIAASWSVDERTGLPRDDLHISVDPIDKSAGTDDAAVAAAVDDHRELAEAVISFLGRDGAAGIVVWLKRASLAGFSAPAGSPSGVRGVRHLSLVARRLTVTDIGSGRTAAFP